jgi:hypothetical protein
MHVQDLRGAYEFRATRLVADESVPKEAHPHPASVLTRIMRTIAIVVHHNWCVQAAQYAREVVRQGRYRCTAEQTPGGLDADADVWPVVYKPKSKSTTRGLLRDVYGSMYSIQRRANGLYLMCTRVRPQGRIRGLDGGGGKP